MSKVICEICGTSYPDTASACPICGFARDMDAQLGEEEYEPEQMPAPRSHSKGGRFAASNVKKRNAGATYHAPAHEDEDDEEDYFEERPAPRKQSGALAVTLMVVVAILLVITVYLFIRVFLPNVISPDPTVPYEPSTSASEYVETEESTLSQEIPCESLRLESGEIVELNVIGQYYLIHTQVLPENTTDAIVYVSSDENIVTVSSDGRLTAVSEGTAEITVTCGTQSVTCTVICTVAEETTVPEEETTAPTQAETEPEQTTQPSDETTAPVEETTAPIEETTEPSEETTASADPNQTIAFVKTDISFFSLGAKYSLQYTPDSIPAEDITWSSTNRNVATVEDGVVKIKGWGVASIYAEYNGVKIECVVRVTKE